MQDANKVEIPQGASLDKTSYRGLIGRLLESPPNKRSTAVPQWSSPGVARSAMFGPANERLPLDATVVRALFMPTKCLNVTGTLR